MKIKPLFFTVVLAAAVLCFATSVNAQTSTQSQIDALLKQISEASAQLKTLQSQQTATSTTTPTTPTTSTWCHTFNTNLGYAQSGTAEIGYLHTALQKQGISYAPDTGNVYANGTSQGVIQFQKKYGIFQTGYVGNATRTQLNSLYGCANTGATSSYSKAAEFGSLVISKDASSPASDILVAGQTATLGVFRLSADYYESLDVDEITISSNYPNIVDTFYFYNGSVLLGSVSGSASATLTLANGTLIIPANSNVKITVKVKIVSSVINGTFVFADLKNDAVKTTGLVSAKPVNSGSQTASSNQMVAYNSRPYFSLSSVSPSGQLIPTANTLLAVFDVKADANGDIAFENNNGSSLSVNINRVQKDADGASQTYILKDGDGTKLDATSVSDTATSVIFDFADSSLIVPAGLTGKLYIYGDTTDLEDSGDAIQLWLDDSNASNVKWGIDGVGSFGEADKIFRGDIFAKTLIKPDGTTQTTCNTQNQCVLGGGGKVCTASSECVTTTPTITVISPNGGEIWQIGETHNITWTSTGMTKVAINLKDYSGANHNYGIASGLNALLGTYSWTVPDNVYVGTGSQYKLEISEYTTSGIYVSDSSDNYFSITSGSTQPSLTVRTPNGGESWTQGTTQNIKWDYNGVGKINIYLVYANGTLCYLTNVPAQQALYSYIMGTVCPDGTGRAITPGQYKIMVTESPSSAHNPPSDSSDNYFSIVAATAQPNVTVTSPNGAEQWQQGTTKTISWQSAGLLSSDKIDVWLWSYTDSSSTPFATDVIVSGLVGNSTLYNWAIPKNLSGARYKIDIEVHRTSGSSLTYDQSDNYFNIVAATSTPCTSFTYSNWNACSALGTQTRTVVSSSPAGCTGGNPVLTQACMPTTDLQFGFGSAGGGWISIAGDWNGDGKATIGLYNPTASTFMLRNSNNSGNADLTFGFGSAGGGWLPITGDWDGNGTTTIGLYDPKASTFYLRNSNSAGYADMTFGFGSASGSWKPVAGDWDGNGTTTIGLYNPTTSTFYLRNSNSAGYADMTFGYGAAGWTPVVGDWDGNGTTTIGLYDYTTSTFYLRNSNNSGNADMTFGYGSPRAKWMPIAGAWSGGSTDKVGLYDGTTSTFYLKGSNTAALNNSALLASISNAINNILAQLKVMLGR